MLHEVPQKRDGGEIDHWPDAHVAWQGVIQADEPMSVPFGVHVFIFHSIEQLRAASRSPDANGHSRVYDDVDGSGVGAVLMLVKDALEVSIVAHEAAHMALFWHQRQDYVGRIGARRWLLYHPEHVAEMIGNLTALIWYGIPESADLS